MVGATTRKSAKKPRLAASRGDVIYVYALVGATVAPELDQGKTGVPGSRETSVIDAGGGLWSVIARVPRRLYDEAAIERGLRDMRWVSSVALQHQAVVGRTMAAGTVIPMKMLTLFASEERLLAHLNRMRPRLEHVLQRVRDCVEFGVRLWFGARSIAPSRAVKTAGASRAGSAFLLRKKQQRDAERERKLGAREAADRVYEQLRQLTRDARRTTPPAGDRARAVLLEASFLVSGRSQARFRKAVEQLRAELAPRGYELVPSGPWPPYHFVDLA